MRETILVVDACSAQLREKERTLQQAMRYRTVGVLQAEQALEWVRSGKEPAPDAVLLDLDSGHASAIAALRALKALKNDLPVIVMAAYGDHHGAAEAIRAGAGDCLNKPVPSERLHLSLQNAMHLRRVNQYIAWLERKTANGMDLSGTISENASFQSALLDAVGNIRTLKSVQEEAIRFALKATDGCMARAARALGIGRSTLYRKIDEYAIEGYISRANQTTRPMMKVSSGDRS